MSRELLEKVDEKARRLSLKRSTLIEILVRDALDRYPRSISIRT